MAKYPYSIPVVDYSSCEYWLRENFGPPWPEAVSGDPLWYQFAGFVKLKTFNVAQRVAECHAPRISTLPFVAVVRVDDNVEAARWARSELGNAMGTTRLWYMHGSLLRFARPELAIECALRFR